MRRFVVAVALACLAAACSGSDGPAVTGATVPKETTTTLSAIEREVEAAFLRSWNLYTQAVASLDPAGLESGYAETALQTTLEEVAKLKAANTPVRYDIEDRKYRIRVVSDDEAEVTDRYLNHAVLLDGETGQPIEPDPNTILEYTYRLRKFGSEWRIVSVR